MKGDPAALSRIRALPKEGISIPQPVLAELRYGIERLPASRRKERLRARLQLICEEILRAAWTDEVSHRFGEVKADLERKGERIEDLDAAIAAHALALGATLVTSNTDHFVRVRGLAVEDWSRTE